MRVPVWLPAALALAASCRPQGKNPLSLKYRSETTPEVLEFREDGRLIIHGGPGSPKGAFRPIDEGRIEITLEGPGRSFAGAMTEDTLILRDQEGTLLTYRRDPKPPRKRTWGRPAPRDEKTRDLVRRISLEASDDCSRGSYEDSLAGYTMALRLIEHDTALEIDAEALRAALRGIQRDYGPRIAADREYRDFTNRRFLGAASPNQLLAEARRLLEKRWNANPPWLANLEETARDLQWAAARRETADGAAGFYFKQAEINRTCRLNDGSGGTARWGLAAAMWREYLSRELDAASRELAEAESRRCDARLAESPGRDE